MRESVKIGTGSILAVVAVAIFLLGLPESSLLTLGLLVVAPLVLATGVLLFGTSTGGRPV